MSSVWPNFWRTASEIPLGTASSRLRTLPSQSVEPAVLGEGGDALGLGIEVEALEELEAELRRLGPALAGGRRSFWSWSLRSPANSLLIVSAWWRIRSRLAPVIIARPASRGDTADEDEEQNPSAANRTRPRPRVGGSSGSADRAVIRASPP